MLLLGAGPVGIELAGEIKAAWPDKHVTLLDVAEDVLGPRFRPELKAELRRQLGDIGVEVLLSSPLRESPPTLPGVLDGRLFAPVMLIGAVLATVAMEYALVTHDFSIVFVAENNSKVTPLLYSLTGLWSALAGSILLWGLILTILTAVFMWRYRRLVSDQVIRWATLVLYVVTAFFFGMMVGPANPFVTTPDVTAGLGPNSLLQDNPLVAIHPPLLYIGFVGFTVPFAFAIGMLVTGRVGER